MRIKTKVAFGVAFLFFVILTVGGLGLYYLSQLSGEAKNILTNNYESLVYTQGVIKNCDSLLIDSLRAAQQIERNISLQERNITEPGEQQATVELRQAFEKIKNRGINHEDINALRKVCLKIQDLNMKAIVRKNEITQETASQASTYVVVIVSIFSLIAFSFIINFPGYVANPIVQLTQSIKSIAGKNYEERLHFVTDGIESALEKARKAANGKDIRIGGGTSTIRQFLQAGHIDEMHLAIAPKFLGSGEHLFAGIDLPKLGFTETQTMYGKGAAHVILKKNK